MSKKKEVRTKHEDVDSIVEEELYLEIENAQKAQRKPSFKQFTRRGLEEIPQKGE